jgi:hypothetical protein
MAVTQPKLQPRFLRLSAMISHYFIALQLSSPDEFQTPHIPADDSSGLIDPWEHGRHQSTPCR